MSRGIHPAIAAIDLEPIMVKAMKEDGLTLAQAEAGALELRRFYTLHKLFPSETFSPSKFMDSMWHLHILDTMKYPGDCQAMFGHFLHHFPYLGLRGKEDEQELATTFDRTKVRYLQTFGEDLIGANAMTLCAAPKCRDSVKATTLCAAACGVKTSTNCSQGCSKTIEASAFCAGACKGDNPSISAVCVDMCDGRMSAVCAGTCAGDNNKPKEPKPACAGACAGTIEASDPHCVSTNKVKYCANNSVVSRPTLAEYLATHPNA